MPFVTPSAERPLTQFSLPPDWTPEQAFAVYEIIRDLERLVWNTYQPHIHEAYRRYREAYLASQSLPENPDVPFDDPIPF
jgi:hypothetical protein